MPKETKSVLYEDINGVLKKIKTANDYFCDEYQTHHLFNPSNADKKHTRQTREHWENIDSDTDVHCG